MVLLIVTVDLEVLLKGLIHLLGLAIAFRMIAGGEMKLDIEGLTEEAGKVRDKLRASIGGDVRGTPCLEKTWRRKSFASSGDVIMSWVGMNMHCLLRETYSCRSWRNKGRLKGGTHEEMLLPQEQQRRDQVEGAQVS